MTSAASYFQQRLSLFQSTLQSQQIALISSAHDIQYFTGFEFLVPEEREAFLVITPTSTHLIVSSFSPAPNFSFLQILRGTRPALLADHVKNLVEILGAKKILFQDQSLFVNEFFALRKIMNNMLEPLEPQIIWKQRMIKDELELQYLRKAGEVVAKAAETIEKYFKVGVSELELSEKIGQLFLEYGADGLGFPTIVAFGEHGTSPHHQPGQTVLTPETAVLIDCGALVNGYRSDLTRTWWFGKKPADEFEIIQGVVKTAYELAVAVLENKNAKEHEPLTAKKIDDITRKFISQEGYGPQFIHTSGHGVGLDIHEPPSLSWNDSTEMKPGMTITIEPGIYLEKKFGYRFENTFCITEAGAELLTQ